MALVFGLLTHLVLQREKEIILNIYKEKAVESASLVALDLVYMMVEENPASITNNITALNASDKVTVGVVGPAGLPAFGTSLTVPPEIFSAQKEHYTTSGDEFLFFKPLLNERRCHACHGDGGHTRGMLVVKSKISGAWTEIHDTAKRLLVFALFLGISSEIFLILILRKMILNPLSRLSAGADILKAGKLDHRIDISSRDEIGSLASSFNLMAESLEASHEGLEKTVAERTRELRVIAELSTEIFKGDLSLPEIVGRFLDAITKEMGYKYSTVCLVNRETGTISQEYKRGLDGGFCNMAISLASDHPFTRTIREAVPTVKRHYEIGAPEGCSNVVIVPILSHQRKRCREINLCSYEHCPAFDNEDERCWMVPDTLCRSPQSVAGKEKIYGCLHCPAFPVIGVLISGRNEDITASSLDSLEILASEIASAIENQRLIDSKQGDIRKLIDLHDVSVDSLQSLDGSLTNSIVSSAAAFANADAAVIWLLGSDGGLHFEASAGIKAELVPKSLTLEKSFIGKALTENRPVETVEMKASECLNDVIHPYGFMYMASIPLKFRDLSIGCLAVFRKRDFLMTDSEKAITLLFASQAAAALNSAQIYGELKTEKEFSEAIFNCAASGIIVLSKDGHVLKINRGGAEILQVDHAEIIGRRITDIYPECEEMLLIDPGLGREITISLPDGSRAPIGFNNSPLFSPAEGSDAVIVLFKNVTEIKKLQAEIKKKAHFETIAKVVSGVAHEVRNPLFGISSIGQILDREIETPQHKALIQAMLKEADRMKRLIEELLLYTRPSRLDIKDIELAPLMEELHLYARAKKEGLSVAFDIQPLLVIKADRDKITQVFLNLLNNAIDAAGQTIRIAAGSVDGLIEIRIADDGPGIRDEDMPKIFDPFFTTKKGGTGLGLPICRKIIEDHGGTIEIFSPGGTGTVVTISLKS